MRLFRERMRMKMRMRMRMRMRIPSIYVWCMYGVYVLYSMSVRVVEKGLCGLKVLRSTM